MKSFILFTLSLILVSSCAYHTGTFTSSSPATRVVYEDVAMGVVTTTNFLGIGGTSKDGLIYEAKKNLINNRPLQNNEEYLNFTVDYKRTNYLLVNTLKVTMTCDVVSRTNDTLKPIYSEKYKAKVLNPNKDTTFFAVGDSIVDLNLQKGVIISFLPKNKVLVLNKLGDNSESTTTYNINEIYAINKWYKGYKSGEVFSLLDSFSHKLLNKKIIGVGLNTFIIKDGSGYAFSIKYSKVKK